MAKLINLEQASENGFLWPTVADTVDTFLRRQACGADSYERLWRLIHIWESIEITLSVAALSRLIAQGETDTKSVLLKCREFFYGLSWDEVTKTFKSSQGAADGSIDQWINILFEISKVPNPPGRYLIALCDFLQKETIELGPLVLAWSRACDVPADARSPQPYAVKHAMRHINTFRNRFAHVPFPHDPLENLADALGNATDQLFAVSPPPSCHVRDGQSSPLTGTLRTPGNALRGIVVRPAIAPEGEAVDEAILFEFPCNVRSNSEGDRWQALCFVHIDRMMRPHILTRVKDEQGTAEYTRYRAEANAVVVRYDVNVHDALPRPHQTEYTPPEDRNIEKAAGLQRVDSMPAAIQAIREERFDDSIPFLEQLVKERPDYHIGWLRLGHARREKALRLGPDSQEEACNLLHQAVSDLGFAANHRDPEYQAQALYEKSKAYFHLARMRRDQETDFNSALADAKEACGLSADYKYQTWLDYLHNSALAVLVRKQGEKEPQGNGVTAT